MELKLQLEGIIHDLSYVKVETTLMLGAVVLLIVGLVQSRVWLNKGVYALVLLVALYFNQTLPIDVSVLSNSLFLTTESQLFSGLFLLVALLLIVFEREEKHSLEFYFISLALVVGSVFITKAADLLVLYLAIELTSFCSYLLTGFSFRKQAFEAAFKYLLFGAGSSAITLFGIGLIYGSAGGLHLSEWTFSAFESIPAQTGLIFLLLGLLFKASVFPMHIWSPAAYQQAPNDAVALMSIVPKLASMLFIHRIVGLSGFDVDAYFIKFLLLFGILTIIVGTFSAINQANLKRMIAFGAIAHSGFLLALVLIDTLAASEALWVYGWVYAIMNVGVFYCIDQYEKQGIFNWRDYHLSGDWFVPVALTLILISLVGIPPLAGFTAKMFLFTVLYDAYLLFGTNLLLIYFIVAVFATVVSLFYYLRIPYQLFLARTPSPSVVNHRIWAKIIATVFGIILLLLFFVPRLITEIKYLLNP